MGKAMIARLCAPVLSLAMASVVGCASASSQQTRQYVDSEQITRPEVILVYDFETGTSQRREDLALAATFSEQVVGALKANGINARRAHPSTQAPLHTLLTEGQFISIDEGSRGQRVVIGFGAGKEEISVRVHMYQMTPQGRRLLTEIVGQSQGGKSPGMAVSAAGAAKTGNPAGLVIGGVLKVKRESGDPVEDALKRLAKDLADRAQRFYKSQGWL